MMFVHLEDWKIHTRLLELKAIDATDCSAQKLCEEFKECLKCKDVSLSNLIGVASDGANSDLPNLVLMQCICHSSALAVSKATALLPRSAENLIRSVSTYISGSVKRTAIIEEIQDFFGEQRKNILKLADRRWLAMHQCVVKILDCWNSLTHYFLVAVSEDHLKSVKAYFYFKYSLNFFNSFNAMFQTQNIMNHKMYTNSVNLLKTFAQNFIKPEFLMIDLLEQLSFSEPKNFLPESEIFVGTECEDFLKTLPQNIVKISRRLPIKKLAFLNPNICFDPTNLSMIKDLHHTRKTFEQYIDNNKVIEEWREMCYEISTAKDYASDNFKFPNICILARFVLCLPHSNAVAERKFSIVNYDKSKKRNRLGDNTMNTVTTIRSSFKDKKITLT
ncbi:protein FAM200B-like [Aphis craccivora]|uniref:Protein FAM200B-like n=1 Tax=Aphis craccivora TaxID=307492 RepID=A0A6G0ZPA1_APHCR|nr:protein FAM200B-like [Aphis craccivora]